MNRASSLEMILGITLGLIIIGLAAYRSSKMPSKGVIGRGAAMGVLAYALIAAPLFTHSGMTLIGLIALLIITGLALCGSAIGAKHPAPPGKLVTGLRMVAGIGFAAALLIAAAQTLSLLGKVDPRVTVVLLLVAVGFLVAGQGLVASSRISSTAMWFMLVPVVLAVALGIFLGSPAVAVAPIREAKALPILAAIAAAIAVFALAWIDGSLGRSRGLSGWSTKRSAIWAIVVGLVFGFGLLMLFGGVVFAPSMEFFVVPANIDALPYLGTVLLAVATVIFAGLISRAFTSVGVIGGGLEGGSGDTNDAEGGESQAADPTDLTDPRFAVSTKWVWIGGGIAAVVALVGVPMNVTLIVAAVAALVVIGLSLAHSKQAS